MFTKTKILFIGVALLLSGGVASAGDPMVLTIDQLDNVTAGGGVRFNSRINEHFRIDKRIREDKRARYDVRTHVKNNSAVAEATSDASGKNTDAQTFTFSQTSSRRSEAASTSIALTE
ncbi:MAG: hypothetical protein V3V18_09880 [Methylococcales bacterium]